MLNRLHLKKKKKTAEVTGDLIGNKVADEITSVGKSKNSEKEEYNEVNKIQEICIPPEKSQQFLYEF